MSEPFDPPHEDLPPLADLMALADITEDDVRDAADKWRENPPVQEFRDLLKAQSNEEE